MIHGELVEDGSATVLVLACQLPDDPLQKGEVLKQEVDVRPAGRLGHPGVIPGNALPNVAAPELRDGQGALGQDPLVLEPVHPCSRCDSASPVRYIDIGYRLSIYRHF